MLIIPIKGYHFESATRGSCSECKELRQPCKDEVEMSLAGRLITKCSDMFAGTVDRDCSRLLEYNDERSVLQ